MFGFDGIIAGHAAGFVCLVMHAWSFGVLGIIPLPFFPSMTGAPHHSLVHV
jgi:hypothetical protein